MDTMDDFEITVHRWIEWTDCDRSAYRVRAEILAAVRKQLKGYPYRSQTVKVMQEGVQPLVRIDYKHKPTYEQALRHMFYKTLPVAMAGFDAPIELPPGWRWIGESTYTSPYSHAKGKATFAQRQAAKAQETVSA